MNLLDNHLKPRAIKIKEISRQMNPIRKISANLFFIFLESKVRRCVQRKLMIDISVNENILVCVLKYMVFIIKDPILKLSVDKTFVQKVMKFHEGK